MQNTIYKEKKGITLISLVITIVVLIILAGISIAMLSGDNGILRKAGEVKKFHGAETIKENIHLSILSAMMENDDQLNTEVLNKHLKEYYPECNVYDIDNQIFVSEINNKIYKIDLSGNIKEDLIPDEYQRVEYISKGSVVAKTSYIDTKVKPTSDTRVVINYMFTDATNASKIPFGIVTAQSSLPSFGAGLNRNNYWQYRFGKSNGWNITESQGDRDTKYKIDLSKNGFYVNNELVSEVNKASFETGYSMYLGALNDSGKPLTSYSAGNITIYDCKIYEDNNLIRYFIPCYRKSDNHVGMYDVINDEFYMNQRTDVFKKGPDVSNNDKY